MTGAWRSCVMELAWDFALEFEGKSAAFRTYLCAYDWLSRYQTGGICQIVEASGRLGRCEPENWVRRTRAKQLIAVTAACLLPPVPARQTQLKVETGMPTM